jgi:hypothetical protein
VDMGQEEDHGFELRNSTECQGGEWGETEAKSTATCAGAVSHYSYDKPRVFHGLE